MRLDLSKGAVLCIVWWIGACTGQSQLEPSLPRVDSSRAVTASVSQDSATEKELIIDLGDLSKPDRKAFSRTLSEYTEAEQKRIMEHNRRPDAKSAFELMREIARRGPLALVLIDRPLKNGALAEVHLNAPPPLTRFFVARKDGLDDEVIDRATGLALVYETQNPSLREPVRLTLFHGGHYVIESASGRRNEGQQFFDAVYTKRGLKSNELLQRAKLTRPTEVPGVGTARVLSLGEPPT